MSSQPTSAANSRSPASIGALLLAALVADGCATASPAPNRAPFTESETRAAEVVGMPGVRFWVDSPAAFMRWREQSASTATPLRLAQEQEQGLVWLALSGGAEDGAYGAGVLNGWSVAGTRPEFTIVSGVSTGALIAPLAFLGPRYDSLLAAIFTQTAPDEIFRSRGRSAVSGSSILDESPLRKRVAEIVDENFLAAIAREHARGRRLLVVTTNLDAQRGTVWDMGAIAASGHPASLKLFRNVLVASASPPGLFAPTYIDVEADGRQFQEMHVDGAIGDPVFSPADVLVLTRGSPPRQTGIKRTLYILVNNKLDPQFEVVENTTIPIVSRSFSTLGEKSLIAEVYRAHRVARENDIEFNLSVIEPRFKAKSAHAFDLEYRRQLYGHGRERALEGSAWTQTPPRLDD